MRRAIALLVVLACAACGRGEPDAARLHRDAIVIDTHSDTTPWFEDPEWRFDERHDDGTEDLPRMREGGLDAQFWSIYMGETPGSGRAIREAVLRIDAVHELVRKHPQDLALATTADEIRRAVSQGRIACLMGVEGGHIIEDSLPVLRTYYRLGVRYLTLTHSFHTSWADSAGTNEPLPPKNGGLTPFGEDVVREMNRLGMLVDVSHVSDATFEDVLRVARAPIIASHSATRAIADHPRNLSDDMLRALAQNGGVVMINYPAAFLSEEFRVASEKKNGNVVAAIDAMSKKCGGNEACTTMEGERIDHEAMMNGDLPKVTWEKIIEHIDHAVKTAGVDHVGLGSDFDGATMPLGMEDASKLPKITDALLKKGYSEADVEKILGGNILKVMEAVERLKGA